MMRVEAGSSLALPTTVTFKPRDFKYSSVRPARPSTIVPLFTDSRAASAVSNTAELLTAEAARLSVNNGTIVEGLAGRTEEYLKSLGLNVTVVGNANELPASTRIISYTGKPYTM